MQAGVENQSAGMFLLLTSIDWDESGNFFLHMRSRDHKQNQTCTI